MTELAARRVPRLGLGLARPSLADTPDDSAIERLIDHALDTGLRYLDTARAYTTRDHPGHSEAVLARVLRRRGPIEEIVVATKGGHYRDGDSFPIDGRPDALRRDCESSLRLLGWDRLDLYFLHYPDPAVALEESVGALADLRSIGLVRSIGLCNISVEQLDDAIRVTPIAAVQSTYSPFDVSNDALIARCGELGIPFIAYSPLGGSRRPRSVGAASPAAAALARGLGVDVETVLIAWVLAKAEGMLALTGASRPATLDSSVAALDVDLTHDDIARIAADFGEGAA